MGSLEGIIVNLEALAFELSFVELYEGFGLGEEGQVEKCEEDNGCDGEYSNYHNYNYLA